VVAKFKEYRIDQPMLFPPSINDYVPKEHLSRFVSKIVEKLNTEDIENKYSNLGQNTYHPKLIIKILFYGYATGVRSGREISKKCETDIAFMYLSQMYNPDFRTINDFRKIHIKEISRYFVDIVRLGKEMGLIKVGQINIDGTKIKANAANRMTMDEKGYDEWERKIRKRIDDMLEDADRIDAEEDLLYGDKRGDELPEDINTPEKLEKKLKEIEEKRKKAKKEGKVNCTDDEAKFMKSGGRIDVGYNCQIAVTEEQMILASEITQEPNDQKELINMVEKTEEAVDEKIKEVAADAGYSSYKNYEYLRHRNITGYIPTNQRGKGKKEHQEKDPYCLDKFEYNESEDNYKCPEGNILRRYKERKRTKTRDWSHIEYKATSCPSCKKKEECTKQKYRTILRHSKRELLEEMEKRLISKIGREKYVKRMSTVEPVFGHIKHNLGYREFLLRGVEKVKCEFRLMCIGVNLKKMNRMLLIKA
jgi:transposase